MAVLDILASQAAISLENARLYAALERENLDRRHAEDALKSSEAFLAEGQRISRTGSWAWNIGTDRMVWSEEHSRIFGYEIDEVGGTFAAVLAKLSPEERASLSTTVGEAVRTGKSFSCEYQIAVPDGSIKHVQSVGRTVPNALGNVDEYVGTTVDITERKRTAEDLRRHEAALREAQSELAHVARVTTMGELTASIAHEVRQPIAGILLNASTCLRWLDRAATEPESIESARAALQRIVRDGNRAGDIITRIQALFRRTQTTKEPLNLNDTVRDIIVLAKGEIDKRRIALGLELSVELPNVLGDRIQLQQVLLNLILNAADAMASVEDRARDLVICTQHSEGQHVQVTVRDSGTGLSRENVEAAFTPFYTTKKNGLGMGLSISRSIVEDHAGRLWATGHEGPGASFHFSLPIAP
jgi:PAS domain S-box-containing protein